MGTTPRSIPSPGAYRAARKHRGNAKRFERRRDRFAHSLLSINSNSMDKGSLPRRWFTCSSRSKALVDPDVVQLGELLD